MRRILYKIKQLHNNQTNIKSSLTGLHQSDFDNTCTQTEMEMEISNPKQSLILSMLPSLLSNGVPSFRFGFAFYLDFQSNLVTSIVMLSHCKVYSVNLIRLQSFFHARLLRSICTCLQRNM